MAFFNPAFLWFLLGGAIPVIIHLLHRQKYKRIRWAAMEFLLAALKKTQKRLKLENLLLLLLRILVMVLAALAISRPFFREAPLDALADSDTHHIFVIDVSYSMGHKKAHKSSLDLAREAADKQLKELRKLTEQDKISVLLMSSFPEVYVPESNKVEYVQRAIADLRLSHYGTSALATFLKVKETVDHSRNQQKRITVFTDFQRVGWEPGDEQEVKRLQALLKDLTRRDDVRVMLVDAGAKETDNRAVVDLRVEQRIVAVRRTTNIAVDVQNWSTSSFPSVVVTLAVDGSALPQKSTPLPATSLTTVNFSYEFHEPGPHFLQASIEPDFLDVDDHRYLALDVKDGLRGLVVDGEPGSKKWESESDYLRTALDPSGEGRFFKVDVKTTELFTAEQLETYDFIVLANVQSLTSDKVEKLEQFVSAGGGLFITLGGRVDRVTYNESLFREGRGLLPASLVEIGGTGPDVDPRVPLRMNHVNYDHPVFRPFRKGLQHAPRDLIFYQHYKVEKQDPDGVIADFDDAVGSPLLLEKSFGDGTVLLWTSSIDPDWNASITGRPPYVPIVRGAMEHLSSRPLSRKNLMVGEFLLHTMTVDKYQPEFVLDTPQEGSVTISPSSPKPDDKFIRIFYPLSRTDRRSEEGKPAENEGLRHAGRYTLARANAKEDEKPLSYFACNLQPRSVSAETMLRAEGNLERVERDELTRRYPDFKFEIIGEKTVAGGIDIARDPSHLWKYLLYLMAGFLVLESILAWHFGRTKA